MRLAGQRLEKIRNWDAESQISCQKILIIRPDCMTEGLLTPNVISFSAATSACVRGGQWERALVSVSLIAGGLRDTKRDQLLCGHFGLREGSTVGASTRVSG